MDWTDRTDRTDRAVVTAVEEKRVCNVCGASEGPLWEYRWKNNVVDVGRVYCDACRLGFDKASVMGCFPEMELVAP